MGHVNRYHTAEYCDICKIILQGIQNGTYLLDLERLCHFLEMDITHLHKVMRRKLAYANKLCNPEHALLFLVSDAALECSQCGANH